MQCFYERALEREEDDSANSDSNSDYNDDINVFTEDEEKASIISSMTLARFYQCRNSDAVNVDLI